MRAWERIKSQHRALFGRVGLKRPDITKGRAANDALQPVALVLTTTKPSHIGQHKRQTRTLGAIHSTGLVFTANSRFSQPSSRRTSQALSQTPAALHVRHTLNFSTQRRAQGRKCPVMLPTSTLETLRMHHLSCARRHRPVRLAPNMIRTRLPS